MRVLDPGHKYLVDEYDGDSVAALTLRFTKREGSSYPGNDGHYPGTKCQEVIRALIDRVDYLNSQVPCDENRRIRLHLIAALGLFEVRAAQRHGFSEEEIEKALWVPNVHKLETCKTCGHIMCNEHATEMED